MQKATGNLAAQASDDTMGGSTANRALRISLQKIWRLPVWQIAKLLDCRSAGLPRLPGPLDCGCAKACRIARLSNCCVRKLVVLRTCWIVGFADGVSDMFIAGLRALPALQGRESSGVACQMSRWPIHAASLQAKTGDAVESLEDGLVAVMDGATECEEDAEEEEDDAEEEA
eukprot:14033078-Alexandrium_andersonii.AAC.1